MKAKKSLGQNFLTDDLVVDKIIEAGEISENDNVLEIGPGRGFLTRALIEKAGKVLVVEKDEELAQYCKKNLSQKKLEVLEGDVLGMNWKEILTQKNFCEAGISPAEICQSDNFSYKLIANIPYYITGKIIRLFLENNFQPEVLVLMVQKEVAERICKKAGKHSILSISVQYFGEPEIVEIVSREKFDPIPDVDSAVLKIKIDREKRRDFEFEKKFFRLVKIGFSNPRKTLINNLSSGFQREKSEIEEFFKKLEFSKNTRAQELEIDDWENLMKLIWA